MIIGLEFYFVGIPEKEFFTHSSRTSNESVSERERERESLKY